MRGMFHSGFEVWRASRASDGRGGHEKTYTKLADVTGRLTPLAGSEAERAQREYDVVAHRFSTPAATDILAGDRLVYGARTLSVDSVRVTSTGLRKECSCEEAI